MRLNDILPAEPALIPSMVPLPSATVALRFAETGMNETMVRTLLNSPEGVLFFKAQHVLITATKHTGLFSDNAPWNEVKPYFLPRASHV